MEMQFFTTVGMIGFKNSWNGQHFFYAGNFAKNLRMHSATIVQTRNFKRNGIDFSFICNDIRCK
ncbi:hypothetical protein RUM4293_03199 [Ruegeria atlantica]|uniref:Uncharacterized protein n=1 Tax=Ruegeria atlantica TaxID=81569 RepID=A0A0P1E7L0_9RHOB|nr:hypothetical protein RUM4293_03199 [Ruegeria atlantica]